MELTDEQFDAMAQYRAKHGRTWKARLTEAWLKDWPEQWGTLRVVRNTVGIADAFTTFAREQKRRDALPGA